LSHTFSPFCSGYFGDGILWTICPGWLRTSRLPNSSSKVAIGVNHKRPADLFIFNIFLVVLLFIYLYFRWHWGLNSGPHAC
jgi:hypothetical protein